MSFVLDASVTLALLYGEETSLDLNRVEQAIVRSNALVPQLWHVEIANAMLIGIRRNSLALDNARQYLAMLLRSTVTVDGETLTRAWTDTLELGAKHGLTGYDAAYFELAVRKRVPLATLDRQLARACEAEGVPLFWS